MRLSLRNKILGVFLLSSIVPALVLWALLHWWLAGGVDGVIGQEVAGRVRRAADDLATELRAAPRDDWNGALDRAGRRQRVKWLLFSSTGAQVAGEATTLPDAVAERLRGRPGGPSETRGLPPPPPAGGVAEPAREAGPVFQVRSSSPMGYWFGVRLPPLGRPGAGEPPGEGPTVLLARAESLYGGGVLFDARPWVVGAAAAFALAGLLWLPLAASLTRAVRQLLRAAEEVSGGRFDVKVDEERGDELGRLGRSIRRMAERLSAQMREQQRFLGDTARELQAPIDRARSALDFLAGRAAVSERTRVEETRDELRNMSELIHELGVFSRAHLDEKPLELRRTLLRPLVEKMRERQAAIAGRVNVAVPADLVARVEPNLLTRVLASLTRNAVRISGGSRPIMVTGGREDERTAWLAVADYGTGTPTPVPPDGSSSALDDGSDTGGFTSTNFGMTTTFGEAQAPASLGLAIVRPCVEAFGAHLSFRRIPPEGFEIRLSLPAGEERVG